MTEMAMRVNTAILDKWETSSVPGIYILYRLGVGEVRDGAAVSSTRTAN